MLEGEWPLVGRNSELRLLRELVVSPDRGALVISGAPGVGKTRLSAQLRHDAEQAGAETVSISATRTASVLPLGAVAFLLPSPERGTAPVTESHAGPTIGHDAVAGGAVTMSLRAAFEALAQRAAGRRLLVSVDDAHWLDDFSAVLVHQLAVTGVAFVLATVTSGAEPASAITDLWHTGPGERVTLGELGRDAVDELLRMVLGGPLDPVAVAVLAEHAQGNLLFLRELVSGAVEAGLLRDHGGMWRLSGPLVPSDRLRDLVGSRLHRLTAAERDLLEAVAVGEPLDVAELSPFGTADLVRGLEVKELLRTRRDGHRVEVRLAHPVHGIVLRQELTPLRARQLAGRLAEAVDTTGTRRRRTSRGWPAGSWKPAWRTPR